MDALSSLSTLRAVAAETAAQWDRCQAEARTWLLRAALLGGERAVRLAATWDSPVLARARQAHCAALAAAARHAAATASVRMIDEEVRVTGYRLRAVQDRWIPGLEQALADVTFAIEELERADAARLRVAAYPAWS